mgnify:FL=1
MITTDRDEFVGFHLTREVKEKVREEASRRKMSMSALIADVIEDWLEVAPQEQVEAKRSNKRAPQNSNEEDVPLPFSE